MTLKHKAVFFLATHTFLSVGYLSNSILISLVTWQHYNPDLSHGPYISAVVMCGLVPGMKIRTGLSHKSAKENFLFSFLFL